MSKVEQQNFNYLAMQQGPVGNAQVRYVLRIPPRSRALWNAGLLVPSLDQSLLTCLPFKQNPCFFIHLSFQFLKLHSYRRQGNFSKVKYTIQSCLCCLHHVYPSWLFSQWLQYLCPLYDFLTSWLCMYLSCLKWPFQFSLYSGTMFVCFKIQYTVFL